MPVLGAVGSTGTILQQFPGWRSRRCATTSASCGHPSGEGGAGVGAAAMFGSTRDCRSVVTRGDADELSVVPAGDSDGWCGLLSDVDGQRV